MEWQVQSLTAIHNQCTTILGAFTSDSAMQAMKDIQTICIRILQMIGETRHLETRPAPTPANPAAAAAALSPSHTNYMEGPLERTHEDVAPLPATIPTTSKSSSLRGRDRGKSQVRGRGRPHKSTAAVAAASPHSFLAPAAAPPKNGDLEGPSYLNQEAEALPAESIYVLEGEKEVETATPPQSEPMHLLEDEEVETTAPPSSESMHVLESEKEVDTAASPFSEPIHMFQSKKEVDTAASLLQDGPNEELVELTEEVPSHVTRPKKKKKSNGGA